MFGIVTTKRLKIYLTKFQVTVLWMLAQHVEERWAEFQGPKDKNGGSMPLWCSLSIRNNVFTKASKKIAIPKNNRQPKWQLANIKTDGIHRACTIILP